MRNSLPFAALLLGLGSAQAADLKADLEASIEGLMPKVIQWRRDFHQYPELSNRETRTARKVAEHLEALGLEVRTGIAHTGVLGILRGGRPGPVVALRADMDALPVTEQTNLPFASTEKAIFNGKTVGVMHACGHDAHTAMLMGAAQALSQMQSELPGTVLFLFQPAEEGAPKGEKGGAKLMLEEGVFADLKPEAIFGLHVWPLQAGRLYVREEGTMAAADRFEVTIKGAQTHGSSPWRGVDPITVAASVVEALALIPSRQLDVTQAPAVVSIGAINGGLRWNIIPDEVTLVGTVRTFDADMREDLLARMERTATKLAEASGASAEFEVQNFAAVTWNDPALTQWAGESLAWAAGDKGVGSLKPITGAEDFSFFQQQLPGVYFFLGVAPEGVPPAEVAPNHSPYFLVNEDALQTGVRALSGLALDYLQDKEQTQQ
ncbi:amidohydrolase [Gallaecimonas sp. GXIMD4217]|uniref:amidohydrolase n=1 Tax=Gallaecimonas sp. GXIMD4217 TaxID=3131927 RepID=UPI00311B0C02